MKKEKIINHWICSDCSEQNGQMVVFYNADDNVCFYCGSKDCIQIIIEKIRTIETN
jgi:DNA-directed RNA polymerase subunit RPC12/RpoP